MPRGNTPPLSSSTKTRRTAVGTVGAALTRIATSAGVESNDPSATPDSFEHDLFARLEQEEDLQQLMISHGTLFKVGTLLSARVFELGECSLGRTITESDRDISTSCDGFEGDICKYSCGEGFSEYGLHICQEMAGNVGLAFNGGICVPFGEVPLNCNGNIRNIPVATVQEASLVESSASQQRHFTTHQYECLSGQVEDKSSCGEGGCAPVVKPNYVEATGTIV